MKHNMDSMKRSGLWPVLLLGCSFLFGGFAGCMFGKLADGSVAAQISAYLHDFLSLLRDDAFVWAAPKVFWNRARWHLACILLALTRVSFVALPVLFALRGALFGFCVTCFVRFLDAAGFLGAGLLCGIPLLLCLPGFFYLGWLGFLSRLRTLGIKSGDFSLGPGSRRKFYSALLWSVVLLVLCVCYECALMPVLLRIALRISQ